MNTNDVDGPEVESEPEEGEITDDEGDDNHAEDGCEGELILQ